MTSEPTVLAGAGDSLRVVRGDGAGAEAGLGAVKLKLRSGSVITFADTGGPAYEPGSVAFWGNAVDGFDHKAGTVGAELSPWPAVAAEWAHLAGRAVVGHTRTAGALVDGQARGTVHVLKFDGRALEGYTRVRDPETWAWGNRLVWVED